MMQNFHVLEIIMFHCMLLIYFTIQHCKKYRSITPDIISRKG